jgi:Xaa-Pro aminopeptidase
MKKLYKTVQSAQLAALEVIKEGSNQRAVDRVARDIIYKAGYEGCFGHGLGHGVGMYIHESPRLSPAAPEGDCLKPGQIVTVEPGIYIAGRFGVRIEDMVVVKPDGLHNFTHSPKELIELF